MAGDIAQRPHLGVEEVRDELARILGDAQVDADDEALTRHTVDELKPLAVARPRSARELADVLRWSYERGLAVSPWGGGTKQGIGRPLSRLDVVVCTGGLRALVEIDEGNLTAEVEAGLAIDELQSHLAAKGLFFALDPLEGGEATLGGIIATNASGPRRLLYRTARDQVLGLLLVLPDGRVLRTGGKTVKDVAGYNLTRPLIGSWGTLGVIAGATLRLLPIPEGSATVLARFGDVGSACRLAMRVRGSELLPAAIEVLSGNAWSAVAQDRRVGEETGRPCLLFGLEGHSEQVERMQRQIGTMAREEGATAVDLYTADEAVRLWGGRRRVSSALTATGDQVVRLKAAVPMASLGGLLAAAEDLAARFALDVAYAGHAGNGLAQVFLAPRAGAGGEAVPTTIARLREVASHMGGHVIIEVAPSVVRRTMDPFPPRDDYALMRAIRQSLNPKDTLNPGKVV